MISFRTIYAFMTTACVSAHSSAEALYPTMDGGPTRWGVGVAALFEDEGYRGIGQKSEGLPILFVQTDRFRLLGPQAELRVLGSRTSGLSLRADYRFDGFKAEDGEIFAGMQERKGSLALGVAGKHAASWGIASFDLVRSLKGSKGIRASATYAYPIRLGPLTVLPKAGVEYFDKKFVDYYYGVRDEEATATRNVYNGKSAVNMDIGMDVEYTLATSHTFLGSLKYRRFGSSIQDSPLVESSGSPRVTLAYLYRF